MSKKSLENSEFNFEQAKELTANWTCTSITTTATSGFKTLQYKDQIFLDRSTNYGLGTILWFNGDVSTNALLW